jgi:hypothetical protein
LQEYIKVNKNKKLFGGLVIPDKDYKHWKINQEEKYDYKNGKWQELN